VGQFNQFKSVDLIVDKSVHNTHEFQKSKKIDIPLFEKDRAIFSCGEMSIASIAYGIDMLDAERRNLEMYRRDG